MCYNLINSLQCRKWTALHLRGWGVWAAWTWAHTTKPAALSRWEPILCLHHHGSMWNATHVGTRPWTRYRQKIITAVQLFRFYTNVIVLPFFSWESQVCLGPLYTMAKGCDYDIVRARLKHIRRLYHGQLEWNFVWSWAFTRSVKR